MLKRALKKIKDLSVQRFGFGGKPIFSILVFFFLVVAIPLTIYASYQTVSHLNYARAEKDVILNINSSESVINYDVSFMAIPVIEEEFWGNDVYNISWVISGPVSFEKLEKSVSKSYPSYFEFNLPAGEYSVSVTVVGSEFTIVKEESFTIE